MKKFKTMAKTGLITAVVVVLALAVAGVAFAQNEAVCPETGDYSKIEWSGTTAQHAGGIAGYGLGTVFNSENDPIQITSFTPPSGYTVIGWCIKRGQLQETGTSFPTPVFDKPAISHLVVYYGEGYEECDQQVRVAEDWTDWVCDGTTCSRTKLIQWLDYYNRSVVCRERTVGDIKDDTPLYDYYATADCDGWAVYYKPRACEAEPVLIVSGKWKDTTTDESFTATGEGFEIFIEEPQNCEECIPEHVFVWFHERGCNLRQRGGPIGGQTRPFVPMQEYYCCPKSIYPTDEGWTGRYINSCQRSQEYTYWNELPQFNRPFICE